jgi:hypothetical protein
VIAEIAAREMMLTLGFPLKAPASELMRVFFEAECFRPFAKDRIEIPQRSEPLT